MRVTSLIKSAFSGAVWLIAAYLIAAVAGKYYAAIIEKQQTIAQYRLVSNVQKLQAAQLNEYEKKLRRAVWFDPGNYHLFLLLGNIHFLQGRPTQAIADFTQALARRKDPPTLLNLSEAYRMVGDRERARFLISEALKYDPNNPSAQAYTREALKRLDRKSR